MTSRDPETTRAPLRAELAAAFARVLPLLPGVLPLGMVYGATAAQAGMSVVSATLLSAGVFAGAAQFASLALLRDGAPWFVAVALVAIINSRYAFLSAATLEHVRAAGGRRAHRWMALPFVVDESYALQTQWRKGAAPSARALVLIGMILWVLWTGATAAGGLVGNALPPVERYGLDYALAGLFVGLFGIFADHARKLAAGAVLVLVAGALALVGQGILAAVVLPPVSAVVLGRWMRHA